MRKAVYTLSFTGWIFKAVGLFFAVSAVATATSWKFDEYTSHQGMQTQEIVTAAEITQQLKCLTRNIYYEAAHEPFEGKVAVAQVTLNRVPNPGFEDTVCGVVYEKNVFYKRVVCQFSWYCLGKAKKQDPVHLATWKESEEVAKKVLLENFRLPGLTMAIYYHADYINPRWTYPKITQIGRHIFYAEKPTDKS